MKFTLEDIFNIPTAVIYEPDKYKSVTSVSIDTRSIKKNSLFVAIKGKNFDGHNYINEAVRKGASAIVAQYKKVNELDNIKVPIIAVRNTQTAYGEIAKIWRNKFSTKVISITGSNGKTTTKEILSHLLESKFKVHKTVANNNNQIGVPLTILSAPQNIDFIVLEHGTNHFGEIEYTAKIAQPDYALITNIGNSHIQYLESKEKIFVEKSELFKNVKENGTVFINNDDQLLKSTKSTVASKVTFGFTKNSDVTCKINVDKKGNEIIIIDGFGKKIETSFPLLGIANVKNYLSAVAISLKVGLTKSDIIKSTKTLTAVKGRLQKKDYNQFTIIDDTYNANPESVESAFEVVKNFQNRSNKILVLGDMFELGASTADLHKNLAKNINRIPNVKVFTIGKNSKLIFNEVNKIEKKHFINRQVLKKYLSTVEIENSVILVKGSRGMKMEEFVKVLENRAA
ncbi:MAG: UDP-N-acetylmuramoyl-tripeptide--D-alanyl-D-alanine ligase [Ignavibacteriales bacterium]|nr:UDP-N-acetylmuramoyl-tripeptide--D-alanyl-D-alanine ligase [Ignavibacteriales bacterium]